MKVFNGAIALACAVATTAAYAADVKEVGSLHVGGRQLTLSGLPVKELVYTAGGPPTKMDPNGDFHTGQMYVQYVKLNNPRARYPLLLWHGGGLTGVTWETKPDGKSGWQMFFINAGHDVYVSDAVERGRASWSRFPEVCQSEPVFRTKKEAWEAFRLAPTALMRPIRRSAKLCRGKTSVRCFRMRLRCRACLAG